MARITNGVKNIVVLKRRSDFLRICDDDGLRVHKYTLVLMAKPTPDKAKLETEKAGFAPTATATCRIGYTTSKRVGGAVERNRARRRLRAAVREVLPAEGMADYDYVIIARNSIVTASYQQISGDLCFAARQIAKYALGLATPPPPRNTAHFSGKKRHHAKTSHTSH